jgi:hypothetical protein
MHQPPLDPKRRKPLVTVEWQREVDVFTGEAETRVFVKMYFDARDSGLLAAMPERLWKLLCLLATYMDENGNCYPSQATIGKHLGISRITANRWVQELLRFRFQGEPMASLVSLGQPRQYHGRWTHNVYKLYPITGLRIFNTDHPERGRSPEGKRPSTVYQKRYTEPQFTHTEYPSTDTVGRYTNQNQVPNQTHTRVDSSSKRTRTVAAAELVAYFHRQANRPESQTATRKELAHADALIREHGEKQCHDLVDLAIAKGAETNFKMREFGAILSYIPEILEEFSREHRKRQQQIAHRRKEADEEERKVDSKAEWAKLSPREKFAIRLRDRIAVQTLVKRRELTPFEIQSTTNTLQREMGLDQDMRR